MNDKPTAAQSFLVDCILGRVDGEQAWERLQALMPVQRAAVEQAVAELVEQAVAELVELVVREPPASGRAAPDRPAPLRSFKDRGQR